MRWLRRLLMGFWGNKNVIPMTKSRRKGNTKTLRTRRNYFHHEILFSAVNFSVLPPCISASVSNRRSTKPFTEQTKSRRKGNTKSIRHLGSRRNNFHSEVYFLPYISCCYFIFVPMWLIACV